MNIEIKLQDSRFCDSCPLLEYRPISCLHLDDAVVHVDENSMKYIRPQECIDKHGE